MDHREVSPRALGIAAALLFFVWLLLTGSLAWDELLVGALVAVGVAMLSRHRLGVLEDLKWTPLFPLHLVSYLGVFLLALVRANFDMARRVLSPSLPINPALVEVRTTLQSDLGKLLLANSITLTPGTLTVDVLDDRLLIHWVDATPGADLDHATQAIAASFEQSLSNLVR